MVLTSCDRWDLLRNTLESLIARNCGGVRFTHTIIIEGSGRQDKPEWWAENVQRYSSYFGKIEWIANEGRRGQIYSIDRAYSQVRTDYIFHCEDDWQFVRTADFLARSQRILERYPQIIQVSLRGNDCNGHPNIGQPPFEGFQIQMPYWNGGWGGINFNPGLRRLSDYQKIGSYGRYTTYGITGLGHELKLSRMMLDAGYRIAVLDEVVAVHTGGTCSVSNNPLDPLPRILIAVPVCHKYEYGEWESKNSPHYKGDGHNGTAYGDDIHISGTNDRIHALRDWLPSRVE